MEGLSCVILCIRGTDLSSLEVIKHMGAESMAHKLLPIDGHVLPCGSALVLLPQGCFLAVPSPAHPGFIHTSETGWSGIPPYRFPFKQVLGVYRNAGAQRGSLYNVLLPTVW